MSKNSRRTPPISVSQNFLTSKKTIERLIGLTNISKKDTVLEIGAGKGHITKALSGKSKTVVAYEIDRKLFESLKPNLAENVTFICNDFLKCHLPKPPYKVFSNIPFCKTSDILRKLTDTDRLPAAMWLVMEKGAAKRFCGIPRESLSSLLLKPYYDAKMIYYFKKDDFHPAPKTDVVMLELKQKPAPDLLPQQRRDFGAFVAHGLKFGLTGSNALLTKRQVSTALKLAKLPPIEQPGIILYVQWLCLFRYWITIKAAQ